MELMRALGREKDSKENFQDQLGFDWPFWILFKHSYHWATTWTHGRGAEASLLIASQARGLSKLKLSFFSRFVMELHCVRAVLVVTYQFQEREHPGWHTPLHYAFSRHTLYPVPSEQCYRQKTTNQLGIIFCIEILTKLCHIWLTKPGSYCMTINAEYTEYKSKNSQRGKVEATMRPAIWSTTLRYVYLLEVLKHQQGVFSNLIDILDNQHLLRVSCISPSRITLPVRQRECMCVCERESGLVKFFMASWQKCGS